MTLLQIVITILFILVLGEGTALLTYYLWRIVTDYLKSTKIPQDKP